MNKNTLNHIYQSFMVDVYRYLLSLYHNEYIAEDIMQEKLKDYTEGNLSGDEKKSIEIELEKLEDYQEFLDEQLNIDDKNNSNKTCFNHKKAAISGIITSIFYSSRDPNRMEIYRDVIQSTIAITEPNVRFGSGGTSVGSFFTATMTGELKKLVGSDEIRTGEMDINFFLVKIGYPEKKWFQNQNHSLFFSYPKSSKNDAMVKDWKKLEKLREGTVAEAYISFDKFYETDEILKKFEHKQVTSVWFAVDTGFENTDFIDEPIGFPYIPIWHSDDMTLTTKREKKGILFSKIVSESKSSPNVDSYGSGKLRNENFIKTLDFLNEYNKITSKVSSIPKLDLQKGIDYINSNGVKIYGMVITGPSKEILKLKQEQWIKGINVGDVQLWNWEE
ncbi:anti-sigma factor [Clostridium lundense]|uniref:anti-sigma factor n=1 Tax=Clostridium lundense TaxID=319475 RepID=UPI000686AC76|nr:anti-sigma factor [Clostridium lundense]